MPKLPIAFLGLGALAAAAPLAAEVVQTSEDGFVTRDTAQVAATPLETWLALIKPGEWWNSAHTWSGDAKNMTLVPQGGGCFCERIPGNDTDGAFAMDGSVLHAVVVQAFPMKVLRLRGGLGPLQGEPATGVLTITLKEIDGGTRVLWEYNVGGPMRFDIATISEAVDGVMSEQLHRLRDHLGALESDSGEAGETASEPEPDEAVAAPQGSAEDGKSAAPSIEAQLDALAAQDE